MDREFLSLLATPYLYLPDFSSGYFAPDFSSIKHYFSTSPRHAGCRSKCKFSDFVGGFGHGV